VSGLASQFQGSTHRAARPRDRWLSAAHRRLPGAWPVEFQFQRACMRSAEHVTREAAMAAFAKGWRGSERRGRAGWRL
jgi:hypothetical protein